MIMKKLAVSTLSLALVSGTAAAQSPFLRPADPVLPVASSASATQTTALPPSAAVPVRVHFGGALTRDGIVPVPVYLQSNVQSSSAANLRPAIVPANQAVSVAAPPRPLRQTSIKTAAASDSVPVPEVDCMGPGCAPYEPPHMDDYRRPYLEPRGYRGYAAGEYLYYWTKRQQSPALLLVGDDFITADDFDGRSHHGGRFTLGYWLDTPCPLAIEGVFMFLGEEHKGFQARSNGFPFIGRPVVDAGGGLVAIPVSDLGLPGTANLETQGRLYGFEVNLRRELGRTTGGHVDMLLGYRQVHLDEGLTVSDNTQFGGGAGPLAGASISTLDQFGTHNQIFGGQVGAEAEVKFGGRFFLDVWGKFMLGYNAQTANISGFTAIQGPPPVGGVTVPAGVLAQPTNIGEHRNNSFTVMPEAGVNVGMNITRNWRVAAGYSVLFLNNVIRPGELIDTTINPAAGRPAAPAFDESTFWAHGVNVQMEIRY
jgi:hypothetical protein